MGGENEKKTEERPHWPKRFLFYRRRSYHRVGRLDVWPFFFFFYPTLLYFWIRLTINQPPCIHNEAYLAQCPTTWQGWVWSLRSTPRDGSGVGLEMLGRPPCLQPTVDGLRDVIEVAVHHPPFLPSFLFLVVACFQALLYLGTHWFVGIRTAVSFSKVTSIKDATHVCVIPSKPLATSELCPIQKDDRWKDKEKSTSCVFSISYQQKRLRYREETQTFESAVFPIDLPCSEYAASVGLTEDDVMRQQQYFGLNTHEVPVPSFMELYKEHAVAPMFVFQIVCCILWMLDEYWQYSLFTLVMLTLLEAQIVYSRLRELKYLHSMRPASQKIWTYRDRRWSLLSSTFLVPGDIIALGRGKDQMPVPCDCLLLEGTVVVDESMLTGESVPQMKTPLISSGEESSKKLDILSLNKENTISAGTSIVVHERHRTHQKDLCPSNSREVDGLSRAFVLRTGFETSQGKLLRTIYFSSQRTTASSKEATVFLFLLLAVALVASGYVLHKGLDDPTRSRFHVTLSCILIVTSVVPPEFPLTMSLAVTLSLILLQKKHIFCTEPFRVPKLGKASLCAFDKTGTLTSDEMRVTQLCGLPEPLGLPRPDAEEENEVETNSPQLVLPFLSSAVMAGCSSLAMVETKTIGDPQEVAALAASGWTLSTGDSRTLKHSQHGPDVLQIVRRFPFASELQRMTTIVKHSGSGKHPSMTKSLEKLNHLPDKPSNSNYLVLMKGAPELIRDHFLSSVPSNFDSEYQNLARKGARVLCLCARWLPPALCGSEAVLTAERSILETNLEFCGFLVLACPVKPGTSTALSQLRKSGHRLVMITGDNALTAAQVAGDVGFGKSKNNSFLILGSGSGGTQQELSPNRSSLVWQSRDGKEVLPADLSVEALTCLSHRWSLCVSGSALDFVKKEETLALCKFVDVFARVSPQQKEYLIINFCALEHTTLMVGDGTNDVGALKAAHAGVALLGMSKEDLKKLTQKGTSGRRVHQPLQSMGKKKKFGEKGSSARMKGRQLVAEMKEEPAIARLGDASIASPFTYRGDNIRCIPQLIRLGRATLVTVIMMYKLMAINSLITAFSLSVLTLDGVKIGDFQSSVDGIICSALFFMISRASPAKELSSQRPVDTIFAPSVLFAILSQSLLHLGVLWTGWTMARSYRPLTFVPDTDGHFEPDLVNTVIFILYCSMHAASFLSNYEGAPTLSPLIQSRTLCKTLLCFVVFIGALVSEMYPDLNEFLSLVPFPSSEFRLKLWGLVLMDIVGAWILGSCSIWLGQRKDKNTSKE